VGPGDLKFLHPTDRPNEPLTAGLPIGPGPGPEVLQGVGAIASAANAEQNSTAAFLSHLANQPNATSAVRDLAGMVGAGPI
jgi:hypothetical protein